MNAPRGNPRWPAAVRPKLWRIRGKALDGLLVILGKYETEPEAQLDLERLTVSGEYRNLKIEALPPPPPPPPPPDARSANSHAPGDAGRGSQS